MSSGRRCAKRGRQLWLPPQSTPASRRRLTSGVFDPAAASRWATTRIRYSPRRSGTLRVEDHTSELGRLESETRCVAIHVNDGLAAVRTLASANARAPAG